MSQSLAARYAAALVDLVIAPGSPVTPENAVRELAIFEAMVKSAPDLAHVLGSPAVSRARKQAAVGKLADQAGLSPIVRNFLFVTIKRGRASLLPLLRQATEELIDTRRGIARATVSSANPLTEAEQERIGQELARVSGRQVRCEFLVDSALLGGVVARIGSTVYDGSVRGQLAELESLLTD
jgi:F-type H+-transporting ATPase subunit delta